MKKDPTLREGLEFESWLFELSLNIAKLRKEKGYSQEEFAEKLGMSQSAIARIESGQNMKCSTVWKISDVLEVELEIFGANKEVEKQKVEFFCTSFTNKKEIVGATAKESELKYNTDNIPFTNFNLNTHAIAY